MKAYLNWHLYLLLVGLLSVWYTINSRYDNSISESDLIAHSGMLISVDTVIADPSKELKFSGPPANYFRFTIDKEPETRYTLLTMRKYGNYHFLESKLNAGEVVTIYTTPQLGRSLGIRASNAVRKVTKHGEVVVPFRERHTSLLPTLFLSILFLGLYVLISRRKARRLAGSAI